MEQMIAAFPSRTPVGLDNIIVYTGPPAAKNQQTRPLRPARALRERDELPSPVGMRTGRAGVVENGSGFDTSNDRDCIDVTPTIDTFVSHEPVSCRRPLDTSNPTGPDDHHSIADMDFFTARSPGVCGDIADSMWTHGDTWSARNEPPHPPSCSMIDSQPVSASAMSSAAAPAEPQQRTWNNGGICLSVGSSPSPEGLSEWPSLAVMRAYAYSAETTAPTDGSIGRDRPSESVWTAQDDAPVAVHTTMRDFPDEILSVGVALEAQPYQSSTLLRVDLQDEHWVHDQDAETADDATLFLAGDHSCPSPGLENSLVHEAIQDSAGATVVDGLGGACEEKGTYDSSDDDIVPWIPKRRRAPPVGGTSAERRDAGQPPMKRQRRKMNTAEPAVTSAPCRTATRPTGCHVPAARSRPRKTIAPTTSTQDEWHVVPRALEIESEPTWEVDRIVRSARKHGKDYYQVLWKPTWEPAESLQGSADTAVAEYRLSNSRKVR